MLNLRRGVVGVVAVLLVGGLASPQTPVAVTAATLVQTYADNELRGDQRFKGQLVRVTGRVSDIAETIFGTPYIRLSAGLGGLVGGGLGELFRGVTCELASTAVGSAAQLSTGQNVALEG
jgi:hypothetical protein